MKRIFGAVLFSFLSVSAHSQGIGKEDVQKRLDAFSAAWAKHVPEEMASFFSSDATLMNPFGELAKGTAAIKGVFQKDIKEGLGKTTNIIKVSDVNNLSPNWVLVDATASIQEATSGTHKNTVRRLHVLFIMTQSAGKLSIQHARVYAFREKR